RKRAHLVESWKTPLFRAVQIPSTFQRYRVALCGVYLALRRAMTTSTSKRGEDLGRLVERVRGEFNEMPGMQLTEAQAARLWGVEPTACRRVVEFLVGSEFLRRTPNGRIARTGR